MGAPLNYVIEIATAPARVWEQMLGDAGYRDWTAAFCEGSYFEGRWETGADMRFLGPQGGGMRARIEAADRPTYVSIQHLGEIRDGVAEQSADWQGCFERYRLLEHPAGTRLEVELTAVPEDYLEMMNSLWPAALARLKALCETSS